MLGLLVAVVLTTSSAVQPPLTCQTGDGIPEEYCQLLGDGIEAVGASRYKEATALLERALRLSLFEAPNYELTGYLALAYCASGQRGRGESLLQDFECMLSVGAGELGCYSGPLSAPQRGAGLTDRCFETMCGEIYLSYYENPTTSALEQIRQLRRQAAAVHEACEP